jgi:hypothetical protein
MTHHFLTTLCAWLCSARPCTICAPWLTSDSDAMCAVATYSEETGKLTTRRRSAVPTGKELAVAEMIFDVIDEDNSDSVEFKELAKWLVQQGEKPSHVQAMFDKIDADSNGSITRGEWMKGWKKGAVFLQAGKDPVDMMQASLQTQGA